MAPPKGNKNNGKSKAISKGGSRGSGGSGSGSGSNPKIIPSGKFKQRQKPSKRQKNKKTKAKVKESVRNDQKIVKKHKWSETRMMIKSKKSQQGKSEDSEEIDLVTPQEAIETVEKKQPSKKKPLSPLKGPVKSKRLGKKPETDEPKESLGDRMRKRLEAARFRQINEELDSAVDSNPVEAFDSNPELFQKYHEAYKGRMEHWPSNPLDIIIKWAKKRLGKDKIIADFGCGEARLSSSVPNKVHSFDLFALNDRVTACDMSKVPLEDESVDAAVFCLSLMGTDVSKFIAEANRVLKKNGLLKIAEVSSRFSGNTLPAFLKRMKKFGFIAKQKGQKSHPSSEIDDDVFLMFEFMKIRNIKNPLGKLPSVQLSPSVYKKR